MEKVRPVPCSLEEYICRASHRYGLLIVVVGLGKRNYWIYRLIEFPLEMVKGSILGIAVFGIYDYLIIQRTSNRLTEEESRNTRTQQTTQQLHLSIPRESKPGSKDGSANNLIQLESMVSWHLDHQPPLLMHFQAGALAGLMQSFLLDAWEIGEYLVLHRKSSFHYLFENLRVLNAELIVRRALHHSIGFATLFGSYEMIRLSMAQSTTNYLLHQGSNTTDNTLVLLQYFRYWGLSKRAQQHKQQQQQPGMASDDKKENKTNLSTTTEVYDVTALPIAITFCAGGLAGQAHYLVSHYLRQWRIGSLALNKKPKKKKQQQQQHHLHGKVKWKAIPWGPFLGSFLSTGVSFVAFQYAGELMEQWMTSESERTARTQMFI